MSKRNKDISGSQSAQKKEKHNEAMKYARRQCQIVWPKMAVMEETVSDGVAQDGCHGMNSAARGHS